MFGKIIFLCIVLSLVEIRATQVSPCTNLPGFKFVNIVGCESEPCDLFDGTNATMRVIFEVPNYSRILKPRCSVFLQGLPGFPYPIGEDACPGLLNGYCPIYEGEVLEYLFYIPIVGYPEIPFSIEFKLLMDDNSALGCFRAKLRTVKPTRNIEADPSGV